MLEGQIQSEESQVMEKEFDGELILERQRTDGARMELNDKVLLLVESEKEVKHIEGRSCAIINIT